jgi:hypothetical protein
MVEVVGSFTYDGLRVSWCNAATSCGYVVIVCASLDDFVRTWELGFRVQGFLAQNEAIRAEAVGLHYLDIPGSPLRLFVLPRYADDFADSNTLYGQIEAAIQPPTSTAEKLAPHLSGLQVFLENEASLAQ